MSGWRLLVPERLAAYTPPAKPAKTEPPPPRVARTAPAESPPPEEDTVADAQCLVDASNAGAPLVQPA